MRLTLPVLLIATLTLTACGTVRDSRLNPFNWFGSSRSVPVERTESETANPLIPTRAGLFQQARARREIYQGSPIEQVSALVVEKVPGGAIIRASGVSAVQGVYGVQLTPEFAEGDIAVDGVLSYRLEAIRPTDARPGGTVPTRTVTAARKITDNELRGVRVIRVEGQSNAQVTRRR